MTYKLKYSLAYHDGNGDSKMNKIERTSNPLITPDFIENKEQIEADHAKRGEYRQYAEFIKNSRKFAEGAILNELKIICESYTKLTGVQIENIEIEFIDSYTIGRKSPMKIISNVKITNERI
jgi:hypothetical protein